MKIFIFLERAITLSKSPSLILMYIIYINQYNNKYVQYWRMTYVYYFVCLLIIKAEYQESLVKN